MLTKRCCILLVFSLVKCTIILCHAIIATPITEKGHKYSYVGKLNLFNICAAFQIKYLFCISTVQKSKRTVVSQFVSNFFSLSAVQITKIYVFLILVAASKNRIKVQIWSPCNQKTGTCINIRIDYCITFGYRSTILSDDKFLIFIYLIQKNS